MNSKFLFIRDFNTSIDTVKKGTILKVVDQDRDYVYLGSKDCLASLTYEEVEKFTEEVKSNHTLESSIKLLNNMTLESNGISKLLNMDKTMLEEALKEITEYIKH